MLLIFDIDGTLADCSDRLAHIRGTGKKNWKAFFDGMWNDSLIKEMILLHDTLSKSLGVEIMYCTGRPEIYRDVTVRWLQNNVNMQISSKVYMRPPKDGRPDYIVKVDLLNQIKQNHGIPDLWFDDRQGVVDVIRKEGIRVLQVAPGDF